MGNKRKACTITVWDNKTKQYRNCKKMAVCGETCKQHATPRKLTRANAGWVCPVCSEEVAFMGFMAGTTITEKQVNLIKALLIQKKVTANQRRIVTERLSTNDKAWAARAIHMLISHTATNNRLFDYSEILD